MAPAIGTAVIIGGIVVVAAGVAYFMYKNKNRDNISINSSSKPVGKLLSDDDRYDTDKTIILTAIVEQDWETLEDLLVSSTQDFPDLIKMIEEALKNKQ
ncbi:MAG: hypothetical protein PHS78_00810 [Aliarcobacter skirrowii]|uniref:hypothetical protein n=1 Tax=Aliarcobacter skirrowii TaxID=28200 RepID=UPI00242DCA9C|nr:hypothetical protein [Aliarcobacter skirrowii]MDD2507562.1 hypothetical protein [Aliarcobacter skirrowii]MDD3495914.1 hypothetical protein [Aliarcobacter skirrowii]